ncbi:prepilin peptidase [Methylocapsa acidiphila]|uniref:prepilin peptidase n=1 Tax=Methylocapsa acidiphila TaxID=133552 RepID=UPI00041B0041|nr:A24 family peptidase [Methylocapsa acidiphila]
MARRVLVATRGARLEHAAAIAFGAATGLASLILVPRPAGYFGCALALLMIAIAFVDARRFVIPNELSFAAFVLGLADAASQDFADPGASVAAAALRGALVGLAFFGLREAYRGLRKRQGIGLGDVKLAVVAGVWLDWAFIPVAVELAALSALAAYGLGRLRAQVPMRRGARLPFGLFFAPAIWICWLLEARLNIF